MGIDRIGQVSFKSKINLNSDEFNVLKNKKIMQNEKLSLKNKPQYF